MALPVTEVGELGGKAKREDTHTCTHMHQHRYKTHNTARTVKENLKISNFYIVFFRPGKVMKKMVKVIEMGIKYIFLLSCSAQKYLIS